MCELDGELNPAAPETVEETGLDIDDVRDLMLKLAATVPQFSTDWAAQQICLPMQIVDDVCWQLKDDRLVEILGENGRFCYRYAATNRGREFAQRLMEFCGYVGPAPVSLEAYSCMLRWQNERLQAGTSEAIRAAIADLVLAETAVQVIELAAASGRSLFLFGPPGNGKTSVATRVHQAASGQVWIPHAIGIAGSVIRVFDPQQHRRADAEGPSTGAVDRRWIKVERPLVIVGGEMTVDALDLAFSPSQRFYEAPLHMKANGGTFVVDDFGRQRIEPEVLLNRWIVPLEQGVDYLTLSTGQKLEVPFSMMLVVATNLAITKVADAAFLRRMGYRVHLDYPTAESYTEIFRQYASGAGLQAEEKLIEYLLNRYRQEDRQLRACEPRDLIERARDICRLRCEPFQLNREVLDLAWIGYFGNM